MQQLLEVTRVPEESLMSNLPAGVPDPGDGIQEQECPHCEGDWQPEDGEPENCPICGGSGILESEPPDEFDHDEEESRR